MARIGKPRKVITVDPVKTPAPSVPAAPQPATVPDKQPVPA